LIEEAKRDDRKKDQKRGEYLNKEIKMSLINDTIMIDNTVKASM